MRNNRAIHDNSTPLFVISPSLQIPESVFSINWTSRSWQRTSMNSPNSSPVIFFSDVALASSCSSFQISRSSLCHVRNQRNDRLWSRFRENRQPRRAWPENQRCHRICPLHRRSFVSCQFDPLVIWSRMACTVRSLQLEDFRALEERPFPAVRTIVSKIFRFPRSRHQPHNHRRNSFRLRRSPSVQGKMSQCAEVVARTRADTITSSFPFSAENESSAGVY